MVVAEGGEVKKSQKESTKESTFWSQITARKSLEVILTEESEADLDRSLTLTDLLAIGIGGTVGSGIFVTTGLIAHAYAGPGVVLSWLIGGVCCCISGLSYAEMSSRLPSAGSAYAYTYYTMGELPAFIVEYGVSAAAVARSWGDKVVFVIEEQFKLNGVGFLNYEYGAFMAGLIQFLSVLLLLLGFSISTRVIKVATVFKVILVIFIMIVGFIHFDISNVSPIVPNTKDKENGLHSFPSFGFTGATQAFFGFVGFDEVCCMAAQTQDTRRVMPKAVLGTIAGVTVLSAGASLALVGMSDYKNISAVSGFTSAFQQHDLDWVAYIVSFGELLTLPFVVVIAFLAQPQLLFAMSKDGLLPEIFSATDKNKNLFWGTAISGTLMTVIAVFVPFTHLEDVICTGVLISFNMTNVALILVLKSTNTFSPENIGPALLWFYIMFTIISAFLITYSDFNEHSNTVPISTVLFSVAVAIMYDIFKVPLVPFIPCVGIALNTYLISTTKWESLLLTVGFLVLCILGYFAYGYQNAESRNNWNRK
eukprot:GSMAST32.ASY1.ANO1.628.1 assembled CDS